MTDLISLYLILCTYVYGSCYSEITIVLIDITLFLGSDALL